MTFALRDGIFKRLCRDAEAQPGAALLPDHRRDQPGRHPPHLRRTADGHREGQAGQAGAPAAEPGGVPGPPERLPDRHHEHGGSVDRPARHRPAAAVRVRRVDAGRLPARRGPRSADIPLGPWLEALNRRICEHVGRDARNLQVGHSFLLEEGQPDQGRRAVLPGRPGRDHPAAGGILLRGLRRPARHPGRRPGRSAEPGHPPRPVRGADGAGTRPGPAGALPGHPDLDPCRDDRRARRGRGPRRARTRTRRGRPRDRRSSVRLAEWQTRLAHLREPDGGRRPRRRPCGAGPGPSAVRVPDVGSPGASHGPVREIDLVRRAGPARRGRDHGRPQAAVGRPADAAPLRLRPAEPAPAARDGPHARRPSGFQDILVWQLVEEAQELLARGLRRAYVRREEALASPRGRIDFQAMAGRGCPRRRRACRASTTAGTRTA